MLWITSVKGGPQRVNHAAVAVNDKIYSFGGYNSDEGFELKHKIDVHVFDTTTLVWRSVNYRNFIEAPEKCYGHTVVAYGRNIYLWGGRNDARACNTLYCFNTIKLKWHVVDVMGEIPKKVDGHSACVIGRHMYIFGGFEDDSESFLNSVHRLNLTTFVWEKVKTLGTPPSSRDFHTASVIDDRMYIFGGRSMKEDSMSQAEIYNNEIMFLDANTMRWVKPHCLGNPPTGRRSHSAVVFNKEIYTVGGLDGRTKYHLNDIHKFNPVTNTWSKMHPNGEPPCPRRRHCSCCVGDQLFLFGGSSPVNPVQYASHYELTHGEGFMSQLYDHSDLYILDFFPSLRRLCQLQIIKSKIKIDNLPKVLREELQYLAEATTINAIDEICRMD